MTFSFSNPDVDRVSLDRRVSALEDKFGTGGPGPGPGPSGGSGNLVGGGVNGAFGGTTVVKDVIDFDQYPDNASSVTEAGVVIKISGDLGAISGSNLPAGSDFKMCVLLPVLYQFPVGDVIRPIYLCRLKLGADITTVLQVRLGLPLTPANFQSLDDFCGIKVAIFDYSVSLYGGPTVSYFDLSLAPIALQLLCPVAKNSFSFTGIISPVQAGVFYGYGVIESDAFGLLNPYKSRRFFCAGGHYGYAAYVKTATDLPAWYRQFYPKSWYS